MNKSLRNILSLLLVLLTGASLNAVADSYNVAPMTAGKVTVSPNDEFVNAPINLINYGTNPVKQITYTLYDFDTQESSEPQTIDFETPFDNTQQVMIPIKPGKSLGKSDVIFNVTEVDGHPNETSVSFTYIERWTVLQAAKKRVVFEDVTGLWCQYCPRGIAIMESLERLYPDEFIGISIHDGDALATNAYNSMLSSTWKNTNRPLIMCARDEKVNTFDGESNFKYELDKTASFDISVKATYDGKDINVTSSVLPCLDTDEGTEYSVAYVLTADGLKNDKWGQSNRVGEWDDQVLPEYDRFKGNESTIYGLVFNQVAIDSKGVQYGVEGSLTRPYTVGTMQTYTVTFENISQHKLIQDKSKLNVCALIIKKVTNGNQIKTTIENAAKCRVESGETDIKQMDNNDANVVTGYYSLDGQRLNAPAKGITIVRYADGTTRKVRK